MVALKMLLVGAFAAGVVVANEPMAQPDPLTPGQTQYLSDGEDDRPCPDGTCQRPRQATKPPRGVMGCVRGACVPRRVRP
ncbi:hypothetical protein LAUMK35_00937 [Mycobacterium pseudokansasii]|uniref:Uncharacterized protein n=1 Tax=Mycobacterium pseudokansasii TaxID=2341080 RepID=A0A498QR81_9MYCO|nr:hypothetical protein LAUMK35_00937 [Mycobacterium pseudokansasii]VAZ90228.1 hypothetical protein LAUMK21_00936 [Mycobacterium pseudokansasii]VBA47550.1 hypothetical protein LAUMK142_00814 [Mycobacterium pseudokansasii]